jgi:hypothetical protein
MQYDHNGGNRGQFIVSRICPIEAPIIISEKTENRWTRIISLQCTSIGHPNQRPGIGNMVHGAEVAKRTPYSLEMTTDEDVTVDIFHSVGPVIDMCTNFGSHQGGSCFSRKLGHVRAQNSRIERNSVSCFAPESPGFPLRTEPSGCFRTATVPVACKYKCG